MKSTVDLVSTYRTSQSLLRSFVFKSHTALPVRSSLSLSYFPCVFMCIASFNTFANAAALHRVCRVFALHPASFSGQQWTAKRCQIPEGTSIRHPCPSFLNYCGRSETFSIEGYDSQKDLFDAVTNVTGVRTGVATTARNSDMSGMDHTIVSFMMRTVMITCKDRDQVPTDKRTIPLWLISLSLSFQLAVQQSCSAYMSQLYHSFR